MYKALEKYEIELEVFVVEWAFSLFSSLIPLEVQIEFYEGFFTEGWNYFYKVCLTLFKLNKKLQKPINDSDDIFMAMKFDKNNEFDDKLKNEEFWKEILYQAYLQDL